MHEKIKKLRETTEQTCPVWNRVKDEAELIYAYWKTIKNQACDLRKYELYHTHDFISFYFDKHIERRLFSSYNVAKQK